MKVIPLTKGWVAWVDDEDYEALAQYPWYAMVLKTTSYAARRERGSRSLVLMHRAILAAPPDLQVDHRTHPAGKIADNRKSNLRLCTPRQNSANMRKPTKKPTSSQFKGVHWSSQTNSWQATICLDGKTKHLGRFAEEAAAALAYDNAAIAAHGSYAGTNYGNLDLDDFLRQVSGL